METKIADKLGQKVEFPCGTTGQRLKACSAGAADAHVTLCICQIGYWIDAVQNLAV